MIKEKDVLEELMIEHIRPPEDDYEGSILEVGEPCASRATCTPYIRVKIAIGTDQHIHCFIAGYLASMKLVYYALPKMIGERVKVRIRHKKWMGRIYIEGSILEYLGK